MARATLVEPREAYVDDDDDYETEDDDDPAEVELEPEEELTIRPFRPEEESLADRIVALKDIVSPTTRATMHSYFLSVASLATTGGRWAGRAAWIGVTSALLIGLPLALCVENEGLLVQQEKDYYAQTQGQQAMISGQPAQGAGSGQSQGIVPPGF